MGWNIDKTATLSTADLCELLAAKPKPMVMAIAKPDDADLRMVLDLVTLLDLVEQGLIFRDGVSPHFGEWGDIDDDTEELDDSRDEQLRRLITILMRFNRTGSINRCAWSIDALMRSGFLDRKSEILETAERFDYAPKHPTPDFDAMATWSAGRDR